MAKASQVVLSENEFYLIKAPNGKVLEVKNFNTENGAAIRLWDYAGHPWQQWKFVDAGGGRTRIRNVLADKYIDLVGMNTSNGAQAQIWTYVSGGNQEWDLERVDSNAQQTRAKVEEVHDPEPTPSQRKHQNDLVRKLNNAGKGRASRKA